MPKYLLLKHYRGGPEPHRPFPPMDQWAPEDVEAHIAFNGTSETARGEWRVRRRAGADTRRTRGRLHALAPEPFDARHHWSGSSRSVWSKSLSALGALEEVERSRRETVVLPGSLTTGVPETSLRNPGGGVGSGRCCS
jgi:hypothetical protein